MTRYAYGFPLALGVFLLAGCAGNPSKEAALLLVDEIDNYQASLAEKISAEQTFYRDIRETLQESAQRQAWVAQRIEARNRIVRFTDKAIVEDKSVQVSLLQQFLRDENAYARERRAAELARKAEIESNYRVSFESLTYKQRELGATRSRLLTLTQDRDASKLLFQRIQEAAAMAKQLEEQADSQTEEL